jgi:PAS domain S-box-containing protein
MPPPPDPESLDFRVLAMQAPVAWSVIDLDGNQVLGNDVYARMFGYEPDEIASLRVTDLTHPDDLDATAGYLSSLVDGQMDRYETDKRYVRKDGSEFVGHLVASVLRDEAGHPTALVGVITDVTRERSLAEALERSEDRLSKMLTNISDTVTLVDASGGIAASTGLHKTILGYPREFWEDRSIFDIVHPDDRAAAEEMAARVLTTVGEEVMSEYRIRHRDGHYEDVEVAAVNLLEDPAVEAVVLTTRNVSARKATERELVRMRDRAMALAQHRGDFVARVSHELRTPLHAVLGLAELLGATDLSGEQTDLVLAIRSGADHLRKTVDDLLDYARIEAEGVALEPGPVHLRDLVDSVVARSAATGYAPTLEVRTVIDPSLPEVVEVDPHRFEQILTNLLGNAIKFTPDGEVVIRLLTTRDGFELAVVDTGPGIPPEFRDLVFQPFGQVPGASGAVEGTGLGLAVVRALAELMGGSISVEDGERGGACFRVQLPLVAGVRVESPAAEPAQTHGVGARLLVVEDDPVNQLLVRRQLELLGHECDIAVGGQDALDRLAPPDHGYDLVLMDWRLPDLDGLDVTRRLRILEVERGTPVPVVAATASAMPEDRAACRAAGMDDFLAKPVSLDDLSRMVARWVPRLLTAGAAESPAPASTVDDHRLGALRDDIGDDGVFESLLATYVEELDRRQLALEEAHLRGDLPAVHRIGHALRSTSELVGAEQLARLCREVELVEDVVELGRVVEHFGRLAALTKGELLRLSDLGVSA